MKKSLFFLLLLLAALSFSSALAFHEHVDIDGAEVLISGYRAPTETEDGSTGDEVCSVCGEIIKKATPIPAIGKQREKAKEENITPQPPVRTKAPENPNTPVPTARPTKEPTPLPPKETPAPTKAPKAAETPQPAEPGESAPTPAPKKKTAKATPQPDLSGEEKNTAFEAPEDPGSAGGSSSASPAAGPSRGGARQKSSSANQPAPSPRDLEAYPIFSSRFPWRRLLMSPEADILLNPAGELIWSPQPEAASPLMMLQIPDLQP